jgi:anti-anti-sigma factor
MTAVNADTDCMNLHLSAVAEEDGVLHVRCRGELVRLDFQPAHESLNALLGPRSYGQRVLLNLEEVALIDSSGLTWLIGIHRAFVREGGLLVLHSIPARVHRMLQLLHLDQVLKIAANVVLARALAIGEATCPR